MSHKRKRKRDTLEADGLYSDGSGVSSSHKKDKVDDVFRFNQHDESDITRMCIDEVQMYPKCSSEYHAGTDYPVELCDKPHVALTAHEQQSSNFEDLLFGLLSDNQSFRVPDTAVVVSSTRDSVHKADTSDTSSDGDTNASDAAGQTRITNHNFEEVSEARLNQMHSILSTGVMNNCNVQSAVSSEFHTANGCSADSKPVTLQSTKKQDKGKKPVKPSPDCAELCSESKRHERKSKKKHKSLLASLSPSQMLCDNRNQHSLLRKVHRTVTMHGAECGKLSSHTTVNVVNHCSELNFSSVENFSSSDPGYCGMPELCKKNKKQQKHKKTIGDYSEFESSQSVRHKKKQEHVSSVVNDMFSNTDSCNVALGKKHNTADRGRMVVKNGCTQIADHLGLSVQNIEPDSEGGCCSLWTSCNKQNAIEKQVKSFQDCDEFEGLQSSSGSGKKKKKKRHRVHDRVSPYEAELQTSSVDKFHTLSTTGVGSSVSKKCLELDIGSTKCLSAFKDDGCIASAESEKPQTNCDRYEKITCVGIENHCHKDCSNLESTPHKTKSKNVISECSSPSLTFFNSSRLTVSSPELCDTADMQKTVVTSTLSTESLLGRSSVCSVINSEDALIEGHSPQLPVHKVSDENEFEHLLFSVVVADESSAVSNSRHENDLNEDSAISSKKCGPEYALSASSSDVDCDEVDTCFVATQRTSVSTQPTSSQAISAGYKLGLCTTDSKFNKVGLMMCESPVKKSENDSTCSTERSPLLLDSTLLPRFCCDVQTPVHLQRVNVNDTDRSGSNLQISYPTVTPGKQV